MRYCVTLTAIMLSLMSECHAVRIEARLSDNEPDDSRVFKIRLPNNWTTWKALGKPDETGTISVDEDFSADLLKKDYIKIKYKLPGQKKKQVEVIRIEKPDNLEKLTLVLSPSKDRTTADYECHVERFYKRPKVSAIFTEMCPQMEVVNFIFPNGEEKDIHHSWFVVRDKVK